MLFKHKPAHITSPLKTLHWLPLFLSEEAKALIRAYEAWWDLSYFSDLSPTTFPLSFLQP